MSKYISIDGTLEAYLDKEVKKDAKGRREEPYSQQIRRLLKVKS
jgi:hypothetical protein